MAFPVIGLPTDRSIFSPTDGGIRCYFGRDLPAPRLCGYCGVPPLPDVEHVPECPLSDESLGLDDCTPGVCLTTGGHIRDGQGVCMRCGTETGRPRRPW